MIVFLLDIILESSILFNSCTINYLGVLVKFMSYQVKIDAFEGPLDLLLHLINTLEIDIYDIPVAQITEQYLLYIKTMQELKLDVASEYLVMAATLLAIKSRMLLPKQDSLMDDEVEVEFEEDPREELVEKLIEYKKFKEAAVQLKSREEDRSLIYTKPPSDLSDFSNEVSEKMNLNVTLYDMLGAFQKLLKRKKLQQPLATKISRQEISIQEKMNEIMGELTLGERKNFYDFFPYPDRKSIVITFLALLELMKRGDILIEQERNFSEIFVLRRV